MVTESNKHLYQQQAIIYLQKYGDRFNIATQPDMTDDIARYDHPIPQGFSTIILKPYLKAVTHSQKLEWWIILMVDHCVTLF